MCRRRAALPAAAVAFCLLAPALTSLVPFTVKAASLTDQDRRERDMYVSVMTREGQPVTSLQPDDFIVREDGARREVLRAIRATDPIDVAVLIDNSHVATRMVPDIRKGIEGFVGRMRELAEISLVAYGERPTMLTGYTKDPAALKQAIGRIFAIRGSGAYLLDGISEAAQGIRKRDNLRSVIVVVSAGGIEYSDLQADEVVRAVVDAGSSLNVVMVGMGRPGGTSGERQRDLVFDRGTAGTGGLRENVLDQMGIANALNGLATDLLNQYRITYARPDSLIPPDSYTVGVRREGLTVRGTPVRDRRTNR